MPSVGKFWARVTRARFPLALICFISAVYLHSSGLSFSQRIEPSSIRHENGAQYIAPLPDLSHSGGLFSYLFQEWTDSSASPRDAKTKLLENALPLGPPHSSHAEISEQGRGRFSHWGNWIRFSAMDSSDPRSNSRTYAVIRRYTLRPYAMVFLLVSSVALFYTAGVKIRHCSNMLVCVYAGAAGALLLLSLAYIASVLYAGLRGYALPAAGLFDFFPGVAWLAIAEPFFPYAFIAAAVAGYAFSWLGTASDRHEDVARRLDRVVVTGFSHFGLPVLLALMIFAVGALVSGTERPTDVHASSIGGLLPFNDARAHLGCAFEQADIGRWAGTCDWRPIASALRSIIVFLGGYGHHSSTLVQAILLATALFLAARTIGVRFGAWSMLAFIGLALVHLRPYVGLMLTEALAGIVALLAIACTVDAWKGTEKRVDAAAVGLTTMALLVRMGSMFTIPALVIWTYWRNRHARQAAALACALSVLTITVVLLASHAVTKLYGSETSQLGGNYAALLVGLTVGGTWQEAERRYGAETAQLKTDAEKTSFLYRKAWENTIADPTVMLSRLWQGESYFIRGLPAFMLSGAQHVLSEDNLLNYVFYFVVLLGFLTNRAVDKDVASYLVLTLVSIAASAPFVIFDDGWRTLSVTHLFLALALAFWLKTAPHSLSRNAVDGKSGGTPWGIVLVAVIVGVLILPTVAWRLHPKIPASIKQELAQFDEAERLVGRQLGWASVAVYADGTELPKDIPAMKFQTFRSILLRSGIETDYHSLLQNEAESTPPFAVFVAYARSPRYGQMVYAIGPIGLLERRDARYWRVRIRELPHVVAFPTWVSFTPIKSY